jgi:hypothetical protein
VTKDATIGTRSNRIRSIGTSRGFDLPQTPLKDAHIAATVDGVRGRTQDPNMVKMSDLLGTQTLAQAYG